MATKKRKGERPDGLIQVTLDVGYYPDGRRKRKYFYGHTRAEANAKKEKFIKLMKEGAKYSKKITVKEWVAEYKTTYRQNVNPLYLEKDNVPYNRLVADLGSRRMIDIKETDLQRSLNKLSGMSFSTCEKYRQTMHKVFERARRNKIINDNPAEGLTLPPYTKGTHRALETWEIELILENWDHPGLHAGLWVMIMLLCGLRRGEMMALEWDTVNLDLKLLEVRQVAVIHPNGVTIEKRAKTDAGIRTIPICQVLFEALSKTPVTDRHGFVCKSAHGRQLTESAVTRGLKTFMTGLERIANGEPPIQKGRRTDIERKENAMDENSNRIRFSFQSHDLRHTYATLLYDAGINVKAAQYFLGHADIHMTLDLYTHLSVERETESRNQTVEYLDRLLDTRVKSTLNFEQIPPPGGNN